MYIQRVTDCSKLYSKISADQLFCHFESHQTHRSSWGHVHRNCGKSSSLSLLGCDILISISLVQFNVVSMRSEKPICTPPRLSEVSPTSPLKEFLLLFLLLLLLLLLQCCFTSTENVWTIRDMGPRMSTSSSTQLQSCFSMLLYVHDDC